MSSFQRVIAGLFLGVFVGLFVGEPAGELGIFGTAYVRLLQMTVLPYLLVSIIGGLGKLNAETAAKIGTSAGLLVLFLWLATMLTNLLLPLAYPNWQSASFFSTSLLESSEKFDFLKLYIPSNIFYSLSNAVVPSVVLFCLLLGVAFIGVRDKEVTLKVVGNIADALMGMASYVTKLAPIGIFAISASAAGTLQPEEMGKLQVFLWGYLAVWALMSFVALPLFVSWSSPFNYRDINKIAGEAMVTAFAAGTVLIVLPMIAERCKELLKENAMASEESMAAVDVMAPTAYSFPSVGTLMGLGFILFSGWYLGSPIGVEQYASYVVMGTLSAFGSMAVAIPFMLDYFGLPADQFELYLLGSVITARFATAMAALHGFIICLLVASSILNKLKWRQLFSALAVHLAISALAMIALGFLLQKIIPYQYAGDKSFEAMVLMAEPAPVYDRPMSALPGDKLAASRLDVVIERGSLRVGYFSDHLPYAFRNNQGQVIGHDLDLIHEFAKDLNIALEIHKVTWANAVDLLNDGSLDVLLGGSAILPERALTVSYSDPHMYHTIGLVVRDEKRDSFRSLESIKQMQDLRLAVLGAGYYFEAIQGFLPTAELLTVSSPRDFFRAEVDNVNAMVFAVEVASAWTLLYPEYSVLVPEGLNSKAPAALAFPKGEMGLVHYTNTWLALKESNGFMDKIYDYWVLGKDPKAELPRWSIMKDVLHWIE